MPYMTFADHVITWVNYSQVYRGPPPRVSDIEELLTPYPLKLILALLGRVSAGLAQHDDMKTQVALCHKLLPRTEAGRAVRALTAQERRRRRQVVFHEVQLLNLAKIAIRTLPITGVTQDPSSLHGIGCALLMVNELMVSSEGRVDIDVMLSISFYNEDPLLHLLARGYELYLSKHSGPRVGKIDLPTRFKRITGMKPEEMWAMLLALISPWSSYSLWKGGNLPEQYRLADLLRDYYKLSDVQAQVIMDLYAVDAAEIQTELRREPATSTIRQFDVIALQKKPMILVDGQPFVVATRQMMQLLGNALYYVYMQPSRTTRGERNQFLTEMGAIFHDYVERCFTRGLATSDVRLVDLDLHPATSPKGKTVKGADFLMVWKHSLVVIEIKGKKYSSRVLSGTDSAALDAKYEDIYIKGAEQIDATIKNFKSGTLTVPGVQADRIKTFYPLLVTLQDGATSPIAQRRLERLLWQKKYLRGKDVRRIQTMDIGELEYFEKALTSGIRPSTLLKGKVARMPGFPWSHYFAYQRPEISEGHNAHLKSVFETQTVAAADFFRARGIKG